MIKYKSKISVLLCSFIAAMLLVSLCPFVKINAAAEEPPVSKGTYESVSVSAMVSAMETFLNVSADMPNGNRGNRAPFSESEKLTANAIYNYALSLKTEDEAGIYSVIRQTFTVEDQALENKTSQNIIVRKKSSKPNAKQIVFAANYDGGSESQSTGISGLLGLSSKENSQDVNAGAMDNATGCAVLYALMNHYKDVTLDTDLVFLFCGAGNYYNSGSDYYVSEMPQSEMNNTLLVFGFRRFGGDSLYMYNEEIETQHSQFLFSIAQKSNLEIEKVPQNIPLIRASLIKRLPYAHWAMLGAQASFMQNHINVAGIFSGALGGLRIDDIESRDFAKRSGTAEDTFVNLKEDFPDYSKQMSRAATLAVSAVEDATFESVMLSSRENFKYYDGFAKKIIVQIVVIGLCVVFAAAIFIVAKHLEKKYPYEPPKSVNVKLAVFGRDYEKEKPGEHIIDLDPFAQAPNQANKKNDPNDPFN